MLDGESMIVIGDGFTGAELARLSCAGVAVTLVFRSRLLPEAEPEIRQALAGYLADEGITVVRGVAYESVSRTEDGGVALAITRNSRPDRLTAERGILRWDFRRQAWRSTVDQPRGRHMHDIKGENWELTMSCRAR